MTRDIFLVNQNPEFLSGFKKKLGHNGTRISAVEKASELSEAPPAGSPVIVIDADRNLERSFDLLKGLQVSEQPFYAILSSEQLLNETVEEIDATSARLALEEKEETKGANRRRTDRRRKPQQSFNELLEERLSEFVKKIGDSDGVNLYRLLMEEVEKPLISLVLKETSGNQVQAAQFLGMHRNTLRKKIKDLSIVSPKKHV